MVELADSLDSGSSAQYGRAGSSPASRTMKSLEITMVSGLFALCLTLLSLAEKHLPEQNPEQNQELFKIPPITLAVFSLVISAR